MGTADRTEKLEDQQTYAIIGAAMEVHRFLGGGFLEAVYQAALALEFAHRRIPYQREVQLPIRYKNVSLGLRYRADSLCFGEVLIELKAVEPFSKADEAQIIHYLVACRLGRGLLFNLGRGSLQYRRFVGPPSPKSPLRSMKSVAPVGRSTIPD